MEKNNGILNILNDLIFEIKRYICLISGPRAQGKPPDQESRRRHGLRLEWRGGL